MSVFGIVTAGFLAFLCWTGTAYGIYNYAQLRHMPIRTPQEVSTGDTVGIEGTISDESTSVTAPLSRESAVIVVWQISRYQFDSDSSNWELVVSDIHHSDSLTLTHDTYEILVELPHDMSGTHIADAHEYSVVATAADASDDIPSHIERFEEKIGEPNTSGLLGDDGEKRRYSEKRFEPGDTVTVYGNVQPTSGDVITGGNFKLTPPTEFDGTFLILQEERQKTLRKRLVGSAITFVIGSVFVAIVLSLV